MVSYKVMIEKCDNANIKLVSVKTLNKRKDTLIVPFEFGLQVNS